MDRRTLDYYDQHAAEISAKYRSIPSGIDPYIAEAFPQPGAKILDIGSGSGRDLAVLLAKGYNAYGLEPADGLRAESIRAFPQLKDRVFPFGLPLPEDADCGSPYDGIVCWAVLMHIPQEQLFDAAFSIKRLLKDGGRLLVSVSRNRPNLDADQRDQVGRLFHPFPPDYLLLLFERLGFALLRRWETADAAGREDIQWVTFLFELQGANRGRPLDRIERVLNRDRKTATYKLALFRALSEIGTKEYQHARWVSDREVAVPIRLIAEKWFRYYWPLFDSDIFVPQNNGESPASSKPVAFRKLQTQIVRRYKDAGRLSQFVVDQASDALPTGLTKLYEETIRCIAKTIKEGPVQYASGNMFRFDTASKSVIMDANAWREFCELGHWIEPAVVLRWAEETERFAKQAIRASQVLDKLLVSPTEERDVLAAKEVFMSMAEKDCVWSGQSLRNRFAIDHAIPFSLWHSNDLWNLFPCDERINLKKSDSLPERDLLLRRKDCIVGYWEVLRNKQQRRFDYEIQMFTGHQDPCGNWQNLVFGRFAEAVEVTAVQRGCERWRP
jgi:SAM-dependent methyltransferase